MPSPTIKQLKEKLKINKAEKHEYEIEILRLREIIEKLNGIIDNHASTINKEQDEIVSLQTFIKSQEVINTKLQNNYPQSIFEYFFGKSDA